MVCSFFPLTSNKVGIEAISNQASWKGENVLLGKGSGWQGRCGLSQLALHVWFCGGGCCKDGFGELIVQREM